MELGRRQLILTSAQDQGGVRDVAQAIEGVVAQQLLLDALRGGGAPPVADEQDQLTNAVQRAIAALDKGEAREGLLYFGFEDERLADMGAEDLDLLVQEYYRLHPEWRDRREAVLLLDEIQVVSGWESFVRRLLDSERVDVFLSGSSARLLSREVATSMRGRAMEALVYPFSFRESLRHQGIEPVGPVDRLPKVHRSRVDRALRDYLTQGGFPEAQGLETRERLELLKGYVDATMLRDVVERHAVSQPIALRWMVRHLLANAAGSFSVHKFHADLRSQGFAVAKDTLHAFVAHLEDAFLIRTVSIATESERRRMANPRKAYPIDPGLIAVFDRSGRANLGHALETAVALELDRRGAEKAYVRTKDGHEVDFLARFVDGSDRSFEGKVSFISPVAEFTPKNVQTPEERAKLVFRVKIELENDEGIFKPGMPADATLR